MDEITLSKTKLVFTIILVLYPSITSTFAANTISSNQTIRYNQTIVSPEQTFELGFFTPDNSTDHHYIGIWYKNISPRTVVWVANRNSPVTDTSGELTLTLTGALLLRDTTTGSVVWSSANSSSVRNPIGRLLDTGNFIISDEINQDNLNPIWQSFDLLTDTLLPGMKHGRNFVTGVDTLSYTSWKSDSDPGSGEFSSRIDTRGYPQLVFMDGEDITFRGGPWNGLKFTGIQNLKPNPFFNITFVLTDTEIYFRYDLIDPSVLMRLVMQPSGHVERLLWLRDKQEWTLYSAPTIDRCDQYAVCGPFGSCNINNSPVCECLKGFEPASPDQWTVGDWSHGCRRTVPLNCEPGVGFNPYSNLKLPDTRKSWYDQTMSIVDCEKMCKRDCSCTAYTYSNISGIRSGCLLWFGELIDIRTFDEADTLYIRFPASELENTRSSNARRQVRVIIPVTASVVMVILVSLCLFYHFYMKNQENQGTALNESTSNLENETGDEDLELPLFNLSTLFKSTNDFSMNNKLGEGGFGAVYKGVLEDGQEIAVKRLAKTSTQGLLELKNEVIMISKLQHRNLVKLLGCCIEGVEKMLIYEYLPNKGLDSFIFDKTQSELLSWSTRYHIIIGIARGLLYLHQDSRLRIIHRDLKVSNILLDIDMNPKISDFGMARTFLGNQLEANTNRVVGTFGYITPEYAGDGLFSIKSDVYSFGVLVLEIVSGKKNRGFIHNEHCNNLVGHAWVLHNEGRSLQLVAKCLGGSINVPQFLRLIQVALLCVQRHPEDRPTMTSTLLMLDSEVPLPSPKDPGFYVGNAEPNTPQFSTSHGTSSNNEISISMLNGR